MEYDWMGPSEDDLQALHTALASRNLAMFHVRWTGDSVQLYGASPGGVNLAEALGSVAYPWQLKGWEDTSLAVVLATGLTQPKQWSAELSWVPMIHFLTYRYIRLGYKPGLYRG